MRYPMNVLAETVVKTICAKSFDNPQIIGISTDGYRVYQVNLNASTGTKNLIDKLKE